MRRHISVLLLLATIAALIAGCSAAPSSIPTATAPAPAPTGTATTGVAAARCTVVSQEATPSPTDSTLFPPPSSSDWSRGPASAAVTFTEYGDFM